MRKETTAVLFVFLLLLSTFGATASAFDWRRDEEPDLPPDVVPYHVDVKTLYLENWWAGVDYYKGVYVIKLTAGIFEITNMYTDKLEITATSFAESNLVMYATKWIYDWLVITPDMIEETPPVPHPDPVSRLLE